MMKNPYEEKHKALLTRITGSVVRLNDVIKEINTQLEQNEKYYADIEYTSSIWVGYKKRVQAYRSAATDEAA
ncbi:hypothetical protein SPRG_08408 [Saprolegnia parasitica CBS 223.65]|uniref:DASH complex subunit DAD4 n=1 Tax=Saprolegnia parasitica (strain CBS 223.65) TaxID=695850 RepID=A0A067CAY2_SAPPC|nr:hypothetical protein SPRG_08408 [Saprolegnia parasitica CBS 223.65]KDO26335.1 hypothetical protein SPRG_08408 [Saprolegnia parasitica CBS 223.65]|eukprot:XP_012203034.1 hypothetical protein SPRG_08408 [Saprolegnia parasitica CBS 223.65]